MWVPCFENLGCKKLMFLVSDGREKKLSGDLGLWPVREYLFVCQENRISWHWSLGGKVLATGNIYILGNELDKSGNIDRNICICRWFLVYLHNETTFSWCYFMFELLLLIYLLPLLMIALLLFKLVVWIVRTAFRFVFWLVKKIFLILGRMLAAAFAFVIGDRASTRRCGRQWRARKSRTCFSGKCGHCLMSTKTLFPCFFHRLLLVAYHSWLGGTVHYNLLEYS